MYAWIRIFIFSVTLLLYSCNVSLSKTRQLENLLPPPPIEMSRDNALQSPYFTVGDWPQENWWEVFQSDELNELILIAIGNNPTLQEANERIEFARQESIVAQAKLYPWVSFDPSYTWEYLSKNGLYRAFNPKIPLNAQLGEITFSLKYELDFWGKNRNLWFANLSKELANEAEAAEAKLIITTSLAQAYFTFKANLLRKKLYTKLLEISTEYVELQNLLSDKALSAKLVPLLLEEKRLEAEKLVIAIEQEIQVNKHLINFLMGRSPDACLSINEDLAEFPSQLELPIDLSLDLLARRPDLMAQIWRVKSLAYETGAAMADFYPDVNLIALVGFESIFMNKMLQWNSGTATVQPAVHLPLFTAGSIQANVDAKTAAFDEAVYAYNNLLLRSVQEVADQLTVVQYVFKQKAQQDLILDNAQERFELTSLLQKKGLRSFLDVYAIHEELIERERENVTLLYNQYFATISLMKALGGGYISPCPVPLQASDDGQCHGS